MNKTDYISELSTGEIMAVSGAMLLSVPSLDMRPQRCLPFTPLWACGPKFPLPPHYIGIPERPQ
jgi:hypothetical protein